MKKEYKKMEKVVESLIPIENIINEFNTIKNLQNLISANGNNFNLISRWIGTGTKIILKNINKNNKIKF